MPPPRTPAEALARAEGRAIRAAYRALLPRLASPAPAAATELPGELVTFSGRGQLPEQVASLRSLLRWAGVPQRVTVVSDGTHRAPDVAVLRRLHERVEVVPWRALVAAARPQPPAKVLAWAETDPIGVKLAVELSLPVRRPMMYADADVLFLPGAADGGLAGLLGEGEDRFLADPEPYLDRRLVTDAEAALTPVNAGFFVLHRPLPWHAALDRLAALDGAPPAYHTEQTVLHLALHAAGARPLDPARYVLSTDDMLQLRDVTRPGRRAGPTLMPVPAPVLRHYTTPVRQKLWAAVGRGTLAAALPGRGPATASA